MEKESRIDVSIVITNYNTKYLLVECLKSVLLQTKYHKIEIIVVDNNSNDGSVEYIKKNFKNIVLICNNENLGFAKANNIGIRQSKGKYICLTNSDVKIIDNCIDKLCWYMDKNCNVGIIGPKTLNKDFTLQFTCRELQNLWDLFGQAIGITKLFRNKFLFKDSFMSYFKHDKIRNVDVLNGSFILIRKESIKKVGLLDERFFFYKEDVDWCRRFRENGMDVVFYPNAKIIHYGGASTKYTPSKFTIEMVRSNFIYWEKYGGSSSLILSYIITFIHSFIRMLVLKIYSLIFNLSEKNNIEKHTEILKWLMKNIITKKLY